MIEEMKRQIQHLDDTFDPSNVGDYKDLLYIIYLNWIENNMNENPKDIVNKVSNLVTGTIKHACLAINSNI